MPTPAEQSERSTAAAWSDAWRAGWVRRVVALGLLGGFLLSPKLWLSDRSYPLTPVSDRLPVIPAPFDLVWFAALLVLLAVITVARQPKRILIVFLVLAGTLALFDQSRWQPWFYQYLFLLGALVRVDHPGTGLQACRVIVAGTYLWSGLNKVQTTFIHEVYPWLLQPLLALLPESIHPTITSTGYLGPLIEIAIAIGLLVRRFRPLAIGLAVAMHLLILFCAGPLGHHWNTVVWPWNVAMILLVILLFGRTQSVSWRAILWPVNAVYPRVALLLFGILPAFHLLGFWDSFLSAALFTGNTLCGEIRIGPDLEPRLPEPLRAHARDVDEGCRIDLLAWSMNEMNVPPYPERRVFRQVARTVAARLDGSITLVIHERPDWWSGRRHSTTTVASPSSESPDWKQADGRTFLEWAKP